MIIRLIDTLIGVALGVALVSITGKHVPEDAYRVKIDEPACYLTYDGPFDAMKAKEPYTYNVREYRCYRK